MTICAYSHVFLNKSAQAHFAPTGALRAPFLHALVPVGRPGTSSCSSQGGTRTRRPSRSPRVPPSIPPTFSLFPRSASKNKLRCRSHTSLFHSSMLMAIPCPMHRISSTELDEASQHTHREHSPNEVVGKVPVQSCRGVCHQKTAEHQFVVRQ